MSAEPLIIDGSKGEGGGQMLRTSLSFSAITGRPVTIENIRANRSKAGLARQHLAGLKLIGQICSAEIRGAEVGSKQVKFSPGRIRHGQYSVDVGTAGSVTLVLQTILPALASVQGESEITLTGGTDVKWSPPVDYYTLVLFPLLRKMGLECSIQVHQRGYFPQGGGKVTARIKAPEKLAPLKLWTMKEIGDIQGKINVTGLPEHVAERIGSTILDHFPEAVLMMDLRKNGPSQGVGIVLSAMDGQTFIGADSLGEKGKPAEKVAQEAIKNLLADIESNASVDVFASDQLLPYMALAGGEITARKLTGHAKTNMEIINTFINRIVIAKESDIVEISA